MGTETSPAWAWEKPVPGWRNYHGPLSLVPLEQGVCPASSGGGEAWREMGKKELVWVSGVHVLLSFQL